MRSIMHPKDVKLSFCYPELSYLVFASFENIVGHQLISQKKFLNSWKLAKCSDCWRFTCALSMILFLRMMNIVLKQQRHRRRSVRKALGFETISSRGLGAVRNNSWSPESLEGSRKTESIRSSNRGTLETWGEKAKRLVGLYQLCTVNSLPCCL